MEALVTALVLGFASAASPCLLPLYPAFLAFLAVGGRGSASRTSTALVGLMVVLGVVTVLVAVGAVVTALSLSLGSLLVFVVPLSTVLLLILGGLMLLGRNPFARLATINVPVVRRPLAQAYVYGLAFGPVALPCTGSFIVALLGISVGIAETATRLLGFVAFGIGLGLPLIGLSLVGAVRAQQLALLLARHHGRLTRIAGAALIVAALAEPVRLALERRAFGL